MKKTIEITTAQHVTIQYELAPWGTRLMALGIDWVIGLMSTALFALALNLLFDTPFLPYYNLAALLTFLFYTLGWEYFNHGQTPGKYITGIKVVKLDGRAPTLGDYLTRTVFRTLDLYLSLGSVATMLILSSPRGQRLGDINANTTVVKTRIQSQYTLESFERLNALSNYVPTYPQVTQLDESDILLIKNILNRSQRIPNKAHRTALHKLQARLVAQLQIPDRSPEEPTEAFLRTLLRDYVTLTR